MCKKLVFLISLVVMLSVAGNASADLVAHWSFDDGSGTDALDFSGNGNDGTVQGGAQWVDGQLGGALQFDGASARVVAPNIPFNSRSFSVLMWVNAVLYTGEQVVFSTGLTGSNNTDMHFRIGGPGSGNVPAGGVRMGFYNNDLDTAGGLIQENTWYHVTFWYDFENQNRRIYIDGILKAEASASPYLGTTGNTVIGAWGTGQWFRGMIDDVQVYSHALTEDEIQSSMLGLGGYPYASNPNPADGAVHADTWVTLSWRPGDFAVSHNVYLGENFDNVNDGTDDTFRGNQATNFYIAGFPGFAYPEGLVPGTTYYWRVDEVNEADPNSPWKGPVWSFSVPPKTAYNPVPADGAEAVALNTILKWTGGFGAKLHTVYFGSNFDTVANATTGIPSGTNSFNPGPLKAAKLYYWRVDEFDGIATYKGKVWSFTTLGAVGNPNPADGAVDISQTPTLTWTPAIPAASHEIYFGDNEEAVRNATKASPEFKATKALGDDSYEPGKLAWNATYYWRIDEVNNTNPDSPWVGKVWSFTTADFMIIDDFEGYTDDDVAGEAVWQSWIDGFGVADNGAQVGYLLPPYAEQTIVHGGGQSMPLLYVNEAGVTNSEAVLALVNARDWTEQGVDELSLWYRGLPGSTGSFTEGPVGTFTMTGSGADIWNNADEFHYSYKTLNGAGTMIARVRSITNTNSWAKAGVMIRETLDAGSKHAMMVVTPAQGISFQRRPQTDGGSSETTTAGITAPYWVKIERGIAGSFTGSSSTDGVTWQMQGTPESIQMGSNVYIGLAVTSHNAGATCEAVFSNVTTTGNVSGQWANRDIGILSNAAEPLYVAVSNASGAPAIVANDDPAAALVVDWTEWRVPLQAFADKGINLRNVDKIAIGLGSKSGMASAGGSGTMYIDDIRLYRP